MNSKNYGKTDAIPRPKLFNCVHPDCAATFAREWRLKEHETIHTGERPFQCPEQGCNRRFSKKSHLARHKLSHGGAKTFRCAFPNCARQFRNKDNLKRHVRYSHGDKDKYFKCHFQDCVATFRKRKAYKTHMATHGIASNFKCMKEGCVAKFHTRVARRAHEKTHSGYPCPQSACQVVAPSWGKLQKHIREHPSVTHDCKECRKKFKKRAALRCHRLRAHTAQKPVLMCPSDGCQAYFTTTFNLQHHIRKVHLQLLKYRCYFPYCARTFAMQESLHRHILRHGPDGGKVKVKQKRSSKHWQKRLQRGHRCPLVEDDLRRLFALHMRFSRRGKVEADLSGLFNERKIPHRVDPEVDLRGLFHLKPPSPLQANAQVPVPTC